jgi:predicted PurR-regulated permease PerM
MAVEMAAVPSSLATRGAVSARVVLRVVLIVVLVFMTLYLIYLLRQPLTWIFIACFLAIALSGPVNWLQRRTRRRGLAIALVYLALILVPVLLAAILVPPIVEQLNKLINNLPAYVTDLQEFIAKNDRLRQLEEDYNITAELQKQASTLPGRVGDAAGILSDIGLGLVNSVFAGVSILVLSLFIIGSGRHWLDWIAERQEPERADWLKRLFDRIGRAVGNYVAGALGQALIAGVLAYLVLLILGVPYAGSLAVVIFLLDLVPLVGATLGAIIVGIITLFNDFPTTTIVWVVWSIVYQQLENNVIQPRIQARAVQVHPFVVLTAVLFGSTLFGVLGALLAIPVAAAIQIAIIEYNSFHQPEFLAPAVPEPPPPPDSEAEPETTDDSD